MGQQYDATPRTGNDNTGLALSSVGGLGGPAVRVVIDENVIRSKSEALRTLQSIRNQIMRNDYPASGGAPAVTFAFPAIQSKMASGQRSQLAIVGDSAVAGWGSGVVTGTGVATGPGNPGNYLRYQAWPQQLARDLATRGLPLPIRSDAYFSCASDTNTTNLQAAQPNIVLGSGWILGNLGISGTILQCPNTSTAPITFTPEVAADSFEIIHSVQSGFGTLVVQDQDGMNVTINTGDTTGAQVLVGSNGLKRTLVTRPVASTKPITIARTGVGNTIYIQGIIPYSSVTPMLEILNIGWPGSRAYGTDSSTPHWNIWAVPANMNASTPYNSLGVLNSDAYILELGTNDANGGIAASDIQTALTNIASKLVGQSSAANVALVKPRTATNAYNMAPDQLATIDAVTANLGLKPVVNFNVINFVTADRFDGTHLTQLGYGKEKDVARVSLIGS